MFGGYKYESGGLSFNLKEILLNNLQLISESAIYYLVFNNMIKDAI